jgi:hypothetical protein
MDERALHILNLMQTYIAEYAHQPVRIYPPELESTLFIKLVQDTMKHILLTLYDANMLTDAIIARIQLQGNLFSQAIHHGFGTTPMSERLPRNLFAFTRNRLRRPQRQ